MSGGPSRPDGRDPAEDHPAAGATGPVERPTGPPVDADDDDDADIVVTAGRGRGAAPSAGPPATPSGATPSGMAPSGPDPAPASPPLRRRSSAPGRSRAPLALLAVVAVLVVAAVAVEALSEPVAVAAPQPVAQGPAPAGSWYCPVVAGPDEPATISVAAAGDDPSTVTVVRYTADGPVADAPAALAPGGTLERELEPGEATGPVAVRWTGGPTVATWRVDGERTAAGPCAGGPSERWYLPALDTAEGSTAAVHLFNPFGEDAVARLRFATPEGGVDLVLTDTILVPAETSTVIDVNEFRPEEVDLGAIVEVQTGRLVAAAEVDYDPAAGTDGPAGRTIVPGATAPTLEAGLGLARSGDGSSTWLSVLNPGEDDAAVEVRVTDPVPDSPLLGEVSVPAGGTARIDLDGASSALEYGVSVAVVNDTPVVVTGSSQLATDDGREGVATALAEAPGQEWAIAGAGTEDRQSRLSFVNPGGAPVTVEVLAEGAPEPWSAVVVPPNGRGALEVSDVSGAQAGIGLRIRSDGPVVPQLRTISTSTPLRLWTAVAVPAADWRGPETRPTVRRDPAIGTSPLRAAPTPDPAADVLAPQAPPAGGPESATAPVEQDPDA